MIYIDDTGSGSLIGGTGIGIYDSETKKYEFEVIPLKYYQNMKHYQNKLYQEQAAKIIKKILKQWQKNKNTEILICSSYIFDKTRQWFKKEKINWKNTKIGDPLQKKVEKSFFNYLTSLGLPENYLKHTRYAFGFHRLLHWVYADRDNRKKLCKTCWKSFQQWGYLDFSVETITNTEARICLKCGKIINVGDKCNYVNYKSKHHEKLIIHSNCK